MSRKVGALEIEVTDLGCNDKAKRIDIRDMNGRQKLCLSYDSIVASMDDAGFAHLYRCANCTSATTKRHLTKFFESCGQSKGFVNTLKWED